MPVIVNPQSSYFDKSFNQNLTSSLVLTIQLDLYGLSLCIYDPEKNKFTGFESFRFVGLKDEDQISKELDSLVKKRDWLRNKFQKVNVIFSNPVTTLIPKALYETKEKDLYLNFNQNVPDNYSVDFNEIKNAEAVNLFGWPTTLKEKLKTLWPGCSIYHTSTIFIDSLLINYKNKTDNNSLFIQVQHEYYTVVYLKDGKLYFHNTFKFKTKEDFIYFLLATIEQLKLNPEDVNVILSGDIDKNSIYYEMVFQYIRNSKFIERNETFNYSYLLDKIAHHKYYVLFNMLQCE